MCKVMEDMRKEERMEVAFRMLKLHKLSYEEIAGFSDLTVNEVKTLDAKHSA